MIFRFINCACVNVKDPAYKKVEPKNEINPIERDKFWAMEEAQEKQRQLEEARKKREELLRLEEERVRREVSIMINV